MVLIMLNINGFHGVPHSPWKVTKLLTIVRNRCSPLSFSQLHRFTYPPDCCTIKSLCTFQQPLHLKMKFSIKDFFSKCDQIRNFLQIWSHLLKKSLMENFIFCTVNSPTSEHKKDYSLTLNNSVIKRDI